MVQVTWGITTL